MYYRKLLAVSCAATLSSYGSVTHAADVVIGVPDWPSVQATAHVLKVALETNLGLEVELQDGSNPVVFDAMDAGTMHVHPEVWLPNNDHLINQFVNAKQTVRMSSNGIDGEQATCVTQATAERTGIVNLGDLKDPEMASQFDADGDGRGDMWIGASDWSSTVIEKIRARSYGYDKTMTLLEKPEAQAHAELNSAVENDQNIAFFCYSPHHIFEQHDLVVLQEPEHDKRKWAIVQPSGTPGWLEKSRAGVAYDTASLHITYSAVLESEQPAAAAMLEKVSLDTDTLSAMTYALVVDEQDPADFAAQWVEENADMVKSWVE